MSQKFVKGRTNNHLTWVMVDSTDFATPESALSAATKIKIYGKLRGGTGTNFVSSGAGSLTNDITHVGASALGIYTIALAKADLSDASAAWYDQYIISLSATGAAYQTLVVDGGIDESALLSRTLVTVSAASDAQSAATQANSRVLLVQSRLSDLDSRLASDLSDVLSGITALSALVSDTHSAAGVGNSRILLVQSRLSDFDSRVSSDFSDIQSNLSNIHSDIKSAIAGITVTISASDVSDIASAVVAGLTVGSDVSDIYSLLTRVDSRVLVAQSYLSDIRSHVSDLQSDFQSRVPKAVATNSQLSDLHSDLRSFLVVMSGVQSDVYSLLSDHHSDFQSRVPKAVATNSQLSDLHSDLKSHLTVSSGVQSDIYSLLSDLHSDVGVLSDVVSNVLSALVVVDDFLDTEVAAILAATDTEVAATLALLDDARTEPGQGAPPVNPDAVTKLDYLYKWARNKKENDGTQNLYYADDGTTVDQKQSTSESGGTVTVGEMATGA